MTVAELTDVVKALSPILAGAGGWCASYITFKVTTEARIKAIETEQTRFKTEDYGPFKEQVKEQNLTMWTKFDAMSSQVTQILQSVTEVKTIVNMMKQTKE